MLFLPKEARCICRHAPLELVGISRPIDPRIKFEGSFQFDGLAGCEHSMHFSCVSLELMNQSGLRWNRRKPLGVFIKGERN
jgi:hypothetical protein